jgi:hypothetical protein
MRIKDITTCLITAACLGRSETLYYRSVAFIQALWYDLRDYLNRKGCGRAYPVRCLQVFVLLWQAKRFTTLKDYRRKIGRVSTSIIKRGFSLIWLPDRVAVPNRAHLATRSYRALSAPNSMASKPWDNTCLVNFQQKPAGDAYEGKRKKISLPKHYITETTKKRLMKRW